MLSPVDSFAAKTARDCLRDLDQARDAWFGLVGSRSPEHVSLALRWLGRHLNEYAWRFHASMQVDAIGQQLHKAPLSTPCQGMEQQGTERKSHAA
jgi:hypothetical protein